MRIVHLADTHLGYRQFAGKLDPARKLNQRECDVYAAWHRAVDVAIERRVGAVVHAGDLFDSPRPAPRALAEALDGFARLRDAGIPLIAIAGNHSTPRFRSGGSVFEVLQRFGVHAAWERPETFRIAGVAFHAVPHEADEEALRRDIDSLVPDPDADANVLILHADLNAVPSSSYGEASATELDQEVLAHAPFDYIAMGHLHRFQAPQANAIYPGSLERLDFADLEGMKAVLEVDLAVGAGAPGFVVRHPLATRPMLDLAVDCRDLDPGAVLAAIEAALEGNELTGAVVRVRLDALQRDVYQALDLGRLERLVEPCLHHVVQVGAGGLRASPEADAETELAFAPFARERMPSGLDAEAVIAIAQTFLRDARAEELEAEDAT
jgi:DNA repair protein SbcD/Mre11